MFSSSSSISMRHCTRCGHELTDAASMEAGIGPVCRNLDNAVLARLIPSNIPVARSIFETLDLTAAAPETVRALTDVHHALFGDGAQAREDWRVEVKRIEWALSYPANNSQRKALTKVVAALGYVGLASLWNGEAATGKASCLFTADRLVIIGPRNKAANIAIRKIIGRKWHDGANTFSTLLPGMSKKGWSVPASEADAFFAMVITHYPNHEGLDAAVAAAKAFTVKPALVVQASAPVSAPAPVAAPKCSLSEQGLMLKVITPYDPAYIQNLKSALPYTDRRWNAAEKCWEVVASHKAVVVDIIKKYFGANAVLA